ncbi:MAG: hypothetical protein R2865_00255 [Deinococcales bacterium]
MKVPNSGVVDSSNDGRAAGDPATFTLGATTRDDAYFSSQDYYTTGFADGAKATNFLISWSQYGLHLWSYPCWL